MNSRLAFQSHIPAFALLLAALCLFPASTAQAQATVWSATLTADEFSQIFGCDNLNPSHDNCSATLTDNDFTYNGTDYDVSTLYWSSANSRLNLDFSQSGQTTSLTGAQIEAAFGSLTLNVDGTALAISEATVGTLAISWSHTLATDWVDGQSVSVSLTEPLCNEVFDTPFPRPTGEINTPVRNLVFGSQRLNGEYPT